MYKKFNKENEETWENERILMHVVWDERKSISEYW